MNKARWRVGERVSWDGGRSARDRGVVTEVTDAVLSVRWDDRTESRIVVGTPWLKRVEEETA